MKVTTRGVERDTVFLRPPAPPRPKKVQAKSAWQEFRDAVYKYRSQLAPFLGLLWFAGCAALVGPVRAGTFPIGTALFAVLGTWITSAIACQGVTDVPEQVPERLRPWFLRYVAACTAYVPEPLRLDRPIERRYAAGCAAVASLWAVCATWNATKPGPRALAASFLLTCVCAAPWWYHRRVRGSIPVRFDGITGSERRQRLTEARKLIVEWTAFTSAGHAQGAKLRGLTYTEWSACLHVILRRGATVQEFTPLRMAKLESAFGEVQAGSVRVERVYRSARMANFRFMLADPHEFPVPPPVDDQYTVDSIPFGLFETGERVMFTLVNTMIGGTTGAGKSGIINMIIRALARIPEVAIIGIDLKPGATELGPWRKVMHALATSPEEARELLAQLRAGMELRGAIMEANGKRKWKPTKEAPFIVLVIDEVHELRKARQMRQLADIMALLRAFGGCGIVATQHPIKDNLPATIKMLCPQKIGAHVEDQSADRVIFGERAGAHGWRPSMIPTDRPGSFLIRSPIHKTPCLARAYWLDDDEIADEAAAWGPVRTIIDHQTWNQIKNVPRDAVRETAAGELNASVDKDHDGIVDAEIVREDDPAELILDAMELRGRKTVKTISEDTGIAQSSVYRWLGKLRDQGLVESPRRGSWVSLRTTADEPTDALTDSQ